MTMTDLPAVACTVAGCSYNHEGCHAPAINVDENDACSTFLPLGVDGGLPKVIAHVGACQRTDCVHNEHAVCGAAAVRISGGDGPAHCETYQPA